MKTQPRYKRTTRCPGTDSRPLLAHEIRIKFILNNYVQSTILQPSDPIEFVQNLLFLDELSRRRPAVGEKEDHIRHNFRPISLLRLRYSLAAISGSVDFAQRRFQSVEDVRGSVRAETVDEGDGGIHVSGRRRRRERLVSFIVSFIRIPTFPPNPNAIGERDDGEVILIVQFSKNLSHGVPDFVEFVSFGHGPADVEDESDELAHRRKTRRREEVDEVIAADLNLAAAGSVIHVVSDAEATDARSEGSALLILDRRGVSDDGLK